MSASQFPVALRGAKASTLMWAHEYEVEPQAAQQLRNIAALPWVYGLRVMPDVHLGKGATVGSVIAMPSAVCPAAVGVDIGCGVNAVRTSLTADDLPDDLSGLRSRIEALITVGFTARDGSVNVRKLGLDRGSDAFWDRFSSLHEGVQYREGRAHLQMGTLGSGNHFLEFCLDQGGRVWLTLHSGSRNIGKELAERHIAVARTLPHNQDLPDRDLAVFLASTPEMVAYRRDLDWAQEYAARNRAVMMALFTQAVREFLPGIQVRLDEQISCHHNYVAEEEIDGQLMLVTRKGAIRAGAGDLGVIPGSMGAASFIVRGLGSAASFNSASHGAGRRMSRSAAKRAFTVADLIEQTAGVESRKDAGVVDEIPGAYKDIHQVMAAQSDLVEVVAQLRQLVCVKG